MIAVGGSIKSKFACVSFVQTYSLCAAAFTPSAMCGRYALSAVTCVWVVRFAPYAQPDVSIVPPESSSGNVSKSAFWIGRPSSSVALSRFRARPGLPPDETIEVAPPITKRSSAKSCTAVDAPPLTFIAVCPSRPLRHSCLWS